ncbi:hypothetical protein J6590_086415 [Homalodisca vitripennis]|nr:hypothetical protein J6590_086415 [Homalodisca vitripennis]
MKTSFTRNHGCPAQWQPQCLSEDVIGLVERGLDFTAAAVLYLLLGSWELQELIGCICSSRQTALVTNTRRGSRKS